MGYLMAILRGMIVAFVACAVLTGREPAIAEPSAPDLRAAEAEVAAAQRAVDEAIRQRALWTTARDAMAEARKALQKQDYAAAARSARFAREQAELGISQLRYPRVPDRG
jgi:hypothetical protein